MKCHEYLGLPSPVNVQGGSRISLTNFQAACPVRVAADPPEPGADDSCAPQAPRPAPPGRGVEACQPAQHPRVLRRDVPVPPPICIAVQTPASTSFASLVVYIFVEGMRCTFYRVLRMFFSAFPPDFFVHLSAHFHFAQFFALFLFQFILRCFFFRLSVSVIF